ncbi:MAG TPA: type 2 isopentenyl-diphosphate Delta-isomerase [Candidatus Kapabacteria bacterium]|nr:type 2 isopentenyl-diphosphate Delta-isomerase [Candidatus Kapabacteria bacterium]
MSSRTVSRKKEHVDLVLKNEVGFHSKTTGFEEWDFVHNALPELDFSETDPAQTFLGKKLAAPFIVSCMTGGYAGAKKINRDLAEVCAEFPIAMGIGSQRQAMESDLFHESFKIAREVAPNIPLIGNIGAAQIAKQTSIDTIRTAVELIRADALAVHLNPAQELLQPEGNPAFKGVLEGIEMLVGKLPIPIIVKEIGAGISAQVAQLLTDTGVKYIDVAGAGGTSWSGVELLRRKSGSVDMSMFWDWGIRTADSIIAVRNVLKKGVVIGSGGITNGLEAAKALALGADMIGAARPMLQELNAHGKKGLQKLIESWIYQLRGAMFLTGSATIAQLQRTPIIQSHKQKSV